MSARGRVISRRTAALIAALAVVLPTSTVVALERAQHSPAPTPAGKAAGAPALQAHAATQAAVERHSSRPRTAPPASGSVGSVSSHRSAATDAAAGHRRRQAATAMASTPSRVRAPMRPATAGAFTLYPPTPGYLYPTSTDPALTSYSDTVYTNGPAHVTVTITRTGDTAVVAQPLVSAPTAATGFDPGVSDLTDEVALVWDGHTTDGSVAPDGLYDATVTAAPEDGSDPLSTTITLGVDSTAPSFSITAPSPSAVLHNNDPVTVAEAADATPVLTFANLHPADQANVGMGSAWTPYSADGMTSVTIASIPGAVPAGACSVVADVQFEDPLYGTHVTTTAAVSFDCEGSFDLSSSWTPTVIYPNAVSYQFTQTAQLPYSLGVDATVTSTVEDANHQTVAHIDTDKAVSAGADPRDRTVYWNGRTDPDQDNAQGAVVPTGVYTVVLTATPNGGDPQTLRLTVGVDDAAAPLTITAPADGSTVDAAGESTVTVAVSGVQSVDELDVTAQSSSLYQQVGSTTAQPGPDGTVSVPVDYSALPTGSYQLSVTMHYTDVLGDTDQYASSTSVTVSLTNPLTVTGATEPLTLTFNGSGTNAANPTFGYTLSRPATVTTTIENSSGSTLDTIEDAVDRWSGQLVATGLSWDGTDGAGHAEPAGTYTLRVHAVAGSDSDSADYTREIDLTRTSAGSLAVTAPVKGNGVPVTFTPADGFDGTYGTIYDKAADAYVGSLYYDSYAEVPAWTGSLDAGSMTNGPHTIYALLTDSSGQQQRTSDLDISVVNDEAITAAYLSSNSLRVHDPGADAVAAQYWLAQPGSVTVRVLDAQGDAVRSYAPQDLGAAANTSQFAWWDGKNDNGVLVDPGDYTMTITATEPVTGTTYTYPSTAADSADQALTVTVSDPDVGTLTAPAAGSTLVSDATGTWTPPAQFAGTVQNVWFVADIGVSDWGYPDSGYTSLSTTAPTEDMASGTWSGPLDLSLLPDGTHQLSALVSWYDADGVSHLSATPTVAVMEQHPRAIKSLGEGAFVTPGVAGSDDTAATVAFALNRDATDVTATVTGPGTSATTVRTLFSHQELSAGSHSMSWDGRDDGGAIVATGTYTLTLAVADGKADSMTSSLGVLTTAPATFTAPAGTVTGTTSFLLDVDASAVADVTGTSLTFDEKGGGSTVPVYVGGATAPTGSATGYTWSVDTTKVPFGNGTLQLVNGPHHADATLYWDDPYGGAHTYSAPTASWSVDNPLLFVGAPAPSLVQPGGGSEVATATTTFKTNVPASGVVTVVTGASGTGEAVRTLGSIALSDVATTVTWDGLDDHGNQVADGLYRITVSATDVVNNTATQSAVVQVDSTAPGAITAPAPGAAVSDTQTLTWTPAAGVTTYRVIFTDSDGTFLAEGRHDTLDDTWTASVDLAQVHDGSYTFGVLVQWQTPWAVDNGAYWTYKTAETVTVNNIASVFDIPDSKYIAPDGGDPASAAYSARFATGAAGMQLTETVVPDGGGDVVRTLVADGVTQGQQPTCPATTITVGGSSTTSYMCDLVSWDGRGDDGAVVANGLYDIVVTVTAASGSTASASIPVGVENRSPALLVSPVDNAVVSDAAHLTYQPTPGFPAAADHFATYGFGIEGIVARYAGGPQNTLQQPALGDPWTGDVDLPASQVSGDFTLQSKIQWTDPYGYVHYYVLGTPLSTDEHTLTLSDHGATNDTAAPLDETFTIAARAADGNPVHYVVDTGEPDGNGGTLQETGDVPADTGAVTVHHVYHQVGTFTPTIVVTDTSGDRRHDILPAIPVTQAPPTAKVQLSATHGVVGLQVSATITGTQPNDDALDYQIDWGDESADRTAAGPLTGGSVTVTHTYQDPSDALGWQVLATVIDGSERATATGAVKVGANVTLTAAVADPGGTTTVDGATVKLSAGTSQPALGITGYTWLFPNAPGTTCTPAGDGCTAIQTDDPNVDFSFAEPGDYPVLLIVTDPDQDPSTSTVTELVRVLDKSTTSVSNLTVNAGAGAQLAYTNADGTVTRAVDNGDGTYTMFGLPDGDDAVDVYKSGYQPQTVTVHVENGAADVDVNLVSGDLGSVETDVSRLSPQVAAAKFGVDLNSAGNMINFEVDATITITGPDGNPVPMKMQALEQDGNLAGLLWTDPQTDQQLSGGCTTPVGCTTSPPVGGMQIMPQIEPVGDHQALFLLKLPAKGTMLKEFYEVDAVIKNLAPAGSDFTFTGGTATLDLGGSGGLGFPVLVNGAEEASKAVDDIPADGQKSVSWVIGGNTEGDWPVQVHYTAKLSPFDTAIRLDSQQANVHVYGAGAVQMIIQTGDQVVANTPFHVRVGLHNVTTDAHVYNAAVSLDPPTATCPQGQPTCWTMLDAGPAPEGFHDIGPDQTVFQDFYLLPSFSGQVDFSKSAAERVSGDKSSVPDKVESLTQANESANPPTFDITDNGDGGVTLDWSADDGATGYQIYAVGDLSSGFGAPIASVGGSQTTLQMTIPAADSTQPLSPMAARLRRFLPRDFTVSDVARNILVGTVKSASKVFDHPMKSTPIPFTCFKPGESLAKDSLGEVLTGCLNNLGTGKGWASKPGTPVDLSGLSIQPTTDAQVVLDTANHVLRVSGAAAVGITSPALGTIPLLSYSSSFSWDFNQPVTLTLDATRMLGLPIQPGAKVTFSSGGLSHLALTMKAPALLGGADAALTVDSDPVTGLHISDAKADFGSVTIAGITAGKASMSYTGNGTNSTWSVSGSVTAPGAVASNVNGSSSYDASGKLTSGSLTIDQLSVAGLGTLKPFTVSTADGASWTGSGSLSTASGATASANVTYTVDPTANTVKSALISVPTLTVPGLLTLSNVKLSYSGSPNGSWTLAGSSGTGASLASLTGTLTTNSSGIATGSMTLTNVKIGGLATLASASLGYTASTQSYAGQVALTFPGNQSAQVDVSIVGGDLTKLSASGINLNTGALQIKGGAFAYDPPNHKYTLSASDANVANLLRLTNLNLNAALSTGTWTYTVDGSGSTTGGVAATVSGSLVVADGRATGGALMVSGLNVGGFLPLDTFSLAYDNSKWGAKVTATNGGGGSIDVDLDANGGVSGGSLSLTDVQLGAAATVSLDAKLSAAGDWSFSASAKLPEGMSGTPLSLSLTYADGAVTDASLSGTVAIRNLVAVTITKATFTAPNNYSLDASVTLPGGGGTIGGSADIKGGVFTSGSFTVQPGTPVPVGYGIFLTSGTLKVVFSPTSISGKVGLSAGPKLPGVGSALSGTVTLGWADHGDGTSAYTLGGTIAVGNQQVGDATLSYDTGTQTATFDGTLGFDVFFASLTGTVKGAVSPGDFTLHANLTGTFFNVPILKDLIGGSGTAQVGLNPSGISACAQFDGRYAWTGGFSYQWGGTWPPTPLQGACDLSSFDPLGSGAAPLLARATTGGRTLRPHVDAVPASFEVPAGQHVYAAAFTGTASAPLVTVTGPDGEVFTTPSDPAMFGVQQPGGRYLVYQDGANKTTYMTFDSPVAGTYQVSVDASTPMTGLAVAHEVPRPTVSATLDGTGSDRTLNYQVAPVIAGESVQFAESVDGASQVLGTVADADGSLPFTALAGSGLHTITATVLRDGLARVSVDLLTFTPSSSTVTTLPAPTPAPGTTPPRTGGGGTTGGGTTGGGTTGGGTTGGGTTGGGTTGGGTTGGGTTGGGTTGGGTTGGGTGMVRAPIARDDSASTAYRHSVTVRVLRNDSDPRQYPLSVIWVGRPGHGHVTPQPAGTLRYTPAAGFAGTDRFQYAITNGKGRFAFATVVVRVRRSPVRVSILDTGCGTGPQPSATVTIRITNPHDNGGTVRYVVTVAGHRRTVRVGDGRSRMVHLGSLGSGRRTVSVRGADTSRWSRTVVMRSCGQPA